MPNVAAWGRMIDGAAHQQTIRLSKVGLTVHFDEGRGGIDVG